MLSMSLPNHIRWCALPLSVTNSHCRFFDGDGSSEPPLSCSSNFERTGDKWPWAVLFILWGDLYVLDTKGPLKGVSYTVPFGPPDGVPPSVVRLHRQSAFNWMWMPSITQSTLFCTLPKEAESCQQTSVIRGTTRHIFSNNMYVRVGHSPRCNGPGNHCSSHKQIMSPHLWNELCAIMCVCERLYSAYANKSWYKPACSKYHNHTISMQ